MNGKSLATLVLLVSPLAPMRIAAQVVTPPAELMATNGSALVPMRFIGQWLGARVAYDPKTLGITFTLGEHTVRLKLNSREASVDNLPVLLAAPPTEVNGTTYLPLGFLSLYLQVPIDWSPETHTATVTHPVTGQKLVLQLAGGEAPPATPAPAPVAPAAPSAAQPAAPPAAGAPEWMRVAESAQLPGDASPDYVMVSDDGRHWAFVESTASGERVVDDRSASSTTYRRCVGLRFAPITGRLAYWGVSGDRKVSLVVDGQEYPTTFPRPGMVLFSANGQRWAALGWEGDPNRPDSRVTTVMVDGVEVGRYWDAGLPSFTPDSAHCAFLAVDPATKQLLLVRDGEAASVSADPAIDLLYAVGPNMTFQTDLGYACDGSLYALYHGDRGWQVMVDSHVIAAYRMSKFCQEAHSSVGGGFDIGHIVYPSSLVVAANAPVAAWWARPQPDSPWICCVGGHEVPATDEVDPAEDRIILSPDGQHVAFRYRHFEGRADDRERVAESVCVDGKVGPKFEDVGDITFSPNSQRCAYVARRLGAGRLAYIIDGKPAGPEMSDVSLLSFSGDSLHHAYAGNRGADDFVVYDGAEWRIPWPEVLALEIAGDGSLRFVVRDGAQLLTITGLPPKPPLVASGRGKS